MQQRKDEFERRCDWRGPQHDSRALAGAYYRYKPRDIAALCNDAGNGVHIRRPKIHRSVLERIAGNAVPYAPTGLPAQYEVTATRGAAPVYETPDEIERRIKAMGPVRNVVLRRRLLYFALLFTTLGYLASPLLFGCLPSSQCASANGPLDPLLKMAMTMLPDLAAPWIQVLRHSPVTLYGLILIFGILFALKAMAWNQTQQLATHAWAALKQRA